MYFDDCFTQKYLITSDPLFGSLCIVGLTWKSLVTERIHWKTTKQAGTELGQAQLPTGIWLYCD